MTYGCLCGLGAVALLVLLRRSGVIRLYDIPDNTFESEEDSSSDESGDNEDGEENEEKGKEK
eukprot:gene8907-9860_t